MLKKFNLKDKFALITGAGGLLGNIRPLFGINKKSPNNNDYMS